MGTVSLPNTFTGGNTALASEVNANFNAIIAEVNGSLSAVNLANGAVTENKLGSGAVTNAKVASDAAIALSKLAALTVSRALVSDGSGEIDVSPVTATELGYLDGVTSAIQTQLDNKVETSNFGPSKIFHGWVASAGNTAGSRLPSGWTVSKAGTGSYVITHNLGTTNYSPVFGAISGSLICDQQDAIVSNANNELGVQVRNTSGTLLDSRFTFIIAVD